MEELEGLLQVEYRSVYSIRHGCSLEAPVTKLYCLNALCEDLRLHMSHWNSIKQRLNTNRWLQPRLGMLLSQLQPVMHAMTSAVYSAVWNLECLIHIGFEVFAHCNNNSNMETLTPEIMWNIARGLEDFNNIVNGLKISSSSSSSYLSFLSSSGFHPMMSFLGLGVGDVENMGTVGNAKKFNKRNSNSKPTALASAATSPTPPHSSSSPSSSTSVSSPSSTSFPPSCNDPDRLASLLFRSFHLPRPRKPLQAIPFSKILNILSNERSKLAAKLTHHFFTCNEHFMRIVNSGGCLPPFEWGDYIPHQALPHSQIPNIPAGDSGDTSDYHTNTYSDSNASNASLNATYLKVIGSMRAPDLSNQVSPLIEFSRKEQEFAESFLLIVCNSTSLLRKNNPPSSKSPHHRSSSHRHGASSAPAWVGSGGGGGKEMKTPMSPVVGRPPRTHFHHSEGLVMSRSDSQRKTVSWGDNADSNIRSMVVACYMDSLWTHLGRNFDLYLDEPAWQGKDCLLVSHLGSVLLFDDTVITVLRNMIEHVCYKGEACEQMLCFAICFFLSFC